MSSSEAEIAERVVRAAALRSALLDRAHEGALCLFNGYTEGAAGLVIELFGRSLVLTTHPQLAARSRAFASELTRLLAAELPFVRSALWKTRGSSEFAVEVVLGSEDELERRVRENGVRYALELSRHREQTLFLDTRELRAYLARELVGQSMLNAFAYTCSLGVAAAAGGAARVVHVDLNRSFLNVGKASYALNGLAVKRSDFMPGDFITISAALRKNGALFDCVIVDGPLFSSTAAGRVDLALQAQRLLNKARPLVGDGGRLIFVNNALFVSGAEQMQLLEQACQDGYLSLEQTVAVPGDVVGLLREGAPAWPSDPAPFNHPTKIAILRVRRKDGRRAGSG